MSRPTPIPLHMQALVCARWQGVRGSCQGAWRWGPGGCRLVVGWLRSVSGIRLEHQLAWEVWV